MAFRLFLFTMMNLLLISSVLSNCRFPGFIDQHDVWVAKYADGASLTAYIKPHIITAKFCPFEGTACEHYVRHCVEVREGNKYVVKHEIRSTGYSPSSYLCIQFVYRSDTVLQIKTSEKSDSPGSGLCNNLVLDNWPLFSSAIGTAPPIRCPFSGGYNMRLISNGRELCSNKMLSPRMESECEAGDGITFDFKHPECIHKNLKTKMMMRLKQHVDCMATWTLNNYHFVILRPDKFQVLCLRLENPLDDLRFGYLFMDLVCDPGNSLGHPQETSNYLKIEFERKVIHSVCENEFEGCSDERFCQTDMKEHCKLTCGPCHLNDICAFPEYLRRVWSLYDRRTEQDNRVRYVNIETYNINFPDVGKFQCLFDNVTNKHRSILLHTFDNGCYPKFTCMETFYSSDTVRQFRLGKSINWPMFPISNVKNRACRSSMFKKEFNIGENREVLKIPKITVVDENYTKSVSCKLSYEFRNHVNGLYFHEGEKCDGCIYHNNDVNPQHFEVRTIKCPESAGLIDYICLAAFKFDNETSAVVTGTRDRYSDKIKQFLCWVFTGSGSKRKILVFHAADCNEVQVKLALAGEIIPKSMFSVKEKPPKRCPLPFKDEPRPYQPIYTPPRYDVTPVSYTPTTKKNLKVIYKSETKTNYQNTPVSESRQVGNGSSSAKSLSFNVIFITVLLSKQWV